MSGWGNSATANAAPSYKILATSAANGQVLYANNTVGAYKSNEAEGVFDLDVATVAALPGGQTAGWNLVKQGTGPVANVTITTGGSGYANTTDYVTFTATGAVSATANLVTNSTGGITGVTNLVGGSGFANVASITTTIHTSAGTTGAVSPVLSGRAGRVTYECLVAMGSIA